jgi:hypothetical protein
MWIAVTYERKMQSWYLLSVVLAVVIVWTSGCRSDVKITQQPPPNQTAQAASARRPADHDLSLLAIDFDPPLDQLELMAGRGVILLAAVQNNGQSVERDIPVTARLFDAEKPGRRPILLLESTAYLDEIAPGEIAIVRFDRLTSLPVRARYDLQVEMGSVAGETELMDNTQTFEVVVEPTPVVAGEILTK